MSQKRHSGLLGTLAGGLSAASRRINAPRSCMNWSVHSLCRYADRVVQVRRLRYSDSSVTVAEANRAIDGCRNSLSCSKSAFFG